LFASYFIIEINEKSILDFDRFLKKIVSISNNKYFKLKSISLQDKVKILTLIKKKNNFKTREARKNNNQLNE